MHVCFIFPTEGYAQDGFDVEDTGASSLVPTEGYALGRLIHSVRVRVRVRDGVRDSVGIRAGVMEKG